MNVGDYVEIISNRSGHGYDIGTIVQIVAPSSPTSFKVMDDHGEKYFVNAVDMLPYVANTTALTTCCGKEMDEIPVEVGVTYSVPKYECLVCGSIYLTNGRKVSNEMPSSTTTHMPTPLPSLDDVIDMPQMPAPTGRVTVSPRPALRPMPINPWAVGEGAQHSLNDYITMNMPNPYAETNSVR